MPAKERLAIALDTADLSTAVALATAVKPHIGIAKIGLQLFSSAGKEAVTAIQELGMAIFLDVKLHDIPNTVHGASTVLGGLGVQYLTVHAAGGVPMLKAAVTGLEGGATARGLPAPMVLAVTVLTSDPHATTELLRARAADAVEAGCRGIVCAAPDVPDIRSVAPNVTTVVPGIRPAGSPSHDQSRIATPAAAIASGADILVIGRAVTHARDPAAAAHAIAREVEDVLADA